MRQSKNKTLLILLLAFVSCGKAPVPKPRGYYRIDLPEASYHRFYQKDFPYSFCISDYSYIKAHDTNERYWIDVIYPKWGAAVHCSYKKINNNLDQLTNDAFDFVYKHAGKATAIPELEYANEEEHVYGIFFELHGNTASPYQFYLTDSATHFFRGATYFNAIPNQDSLQPIVDYLQADIKQMIETFKWQ